MTGNVPVSVPESVDSSEKESWTTSIVIGDPEASNASITCTNLSVRYICALVFPGRRVQGRSPSERRFAPLAINMLAVLTVARDTGFVN